VAGVDAKIRWPTGRRQGADTKKPPRIGQYHEAVPGGFRPEGHCTEADAEMPPLESEDRKPLLRKSRPERQLSRGSHQEPKSERPKGGRQSAAAKCWETSAMGSRQGFSEIARDQGISRKMSLRLK